MSYKHTLFIDIGETNAFYTLRETYLHEQWVGGEGGYMHREVRSFHHFNLSQDADEAIKKAAEYAERMGLPMSTTREELDGKMRDIKRATAEEMEQREAHYAQVRAEREAQWAAEKAARFTTLDSGVVCFGKYKDYKFDELPPSYVGWLVSKASEFEAGSLMHYLAVSLRDKHAHLLPTAPLPDLLIGKPGERMELDVTVLGRFTYTRPAFNQPWREQVVFIITMITKDRACVVCKSSSFDANEGDKMRIKATVKAHDSYKGQAQTVLQRVKVVEVAEIKKVNSGRRGRIIANQTAASPWVRGLAVGR